MGAVSYRVDEFAKSGQFLGQDNGIKRGRITGARIVRFTFGTWEASAIKLGVKNEQTSEETEAHFALGAIEDFAPSEDGLSLEKVGERERISESIGGAVFLGSLQANGYGIKEIDEVSDDISKLEGLDAEWGAIPAKGAKASADPKKQARTDVVVTKIISFPWDAGKPAAAAKGAPASAKAGTGAGKTAPAAKGAPDASILDGPIAEAAKAAVMDFITNEKTKKNELMKHTNAYCIALIAGGEMKEEDKPKTIKLAMDDAFLRALAAAGEISFGDGLLGMPA